MNPETPEKPKNRPLNRKFLLRGFVICVCFMLLPFAGIKAWKQSLFFFYKGLWEQNFQGDFIVYYSWNEIMTDSTSGQTMTADALWQAAQQCLNNFGCEIIYSEESYLPLHIYFNDTSQYAIELQSVINCSDLADMTELYREETQQYCRTLGFEPNTNNE
jgi:hypothetical protein